MDRVCSCKGINMLREMMEVYAAFLAGDPSHNNRMRILSRRMYDHIDEQAKKPGNEALLNQAQPYLDKEKKILNAVKFGDAQPWQAMETVRDDIHKSDALKQLFVCGGPFPRAEDMSNEAQIVKVAMEILADPAGEYENPPQAAKIPLDELAKTLECGV